ncbi:thioredoxin family protein [Sulfurimonas sp. SAG-AH-194-I05]|nr:DUF255 domain-containing protein [Sulfurimonas sp. SAG-AH-194-I05]MDF1874606.1 thioredoxin family protein [Sulfurimonas sp. SAG-AH-194-I05]
MKILFVCILLTASLFSQGIQWEKDFETGLANAKKQNKPTLFVYSRHSCHYCRVLDENTFKDPAVIKALNENFISIISYTDENDYTPRHLMARGTPAIWFLDTNGTPMFQRMMGAVKADAFLYALRQVKAYYKDSNTQVKK